MIVQKFACWIAACAVLLGGNHCLAAEFTWNTVAAGALWSSAGSWSPAGGPPGAADNATLGTLASAYTATLNTNQSINNLTINASNATLNLTGGSLTAGGTIAVNSGTFNLGSTLVVNGTLSTGGSGVVNWTGGSLVGGGTLAGTITVAGGDKFVGGDTLKTAGTLNWTAGRIFAGSPTTRLTNLSGGLIDFRDNGTAFSNIGSNFGTLDNQGTLRKSAGTGITTVGWAVSLSPGGTLDGQVGFLALDGGGTLGNGVTTVTGAGVVALNGGTFTVNAGATFTAQPTGASTLYWTGGSLVGGGTLAGTITVAGGDKFVGGDTLKTAGTLNWTAGRILAGSPTTRLTNLSGGLIDFRDNGTAFSNFSSNFGTLDNQGTLRKSAGTGITTVGWVTQNAGLIDAQIGTLEFTNGTVTNTGTVNAGNGATVSASGLLSNEGGVVQGAAAGTGTYSGILTFSSGSTLAAGGTTSSGRLILNGNLVMNNESTFHVNLNGSTVTTGFDRVLVNGTVALNNATLGGATGAAFNPTGADRLFVLVNDGSESISGSFAGLAQNGTGVLGGWNFQISYQGNFDTGNLTGGNDIVLYNFQPVPEPASILAVAAGALGVAGWVRRRRTAKRAAGAGPL